MGIPLTVLQCHECVIIINAFTQDTTILSTSEVLVCDASFMITVGGDCY